MLKRPLTAIELKNDDLECLKDSLRETLVAQGLIPPKHSDNFEKTILSSKKNKFDLPVLHLMRCSSEMDSQRRMEGEIDDVQTYRDALNRLANINNNNNANANNDDNNNNNNEED